jgi:nucleoside-diphosphate-sugar epimerase
MSRTALVTGVTGFIGGRLAERLLADGWTVHALVRECSDRPSLEGLRFHVHCGNVEGLTAILRATGPDIVFHLASLYLPEHRSDQVDDLVASNILLPAQIAEAMSACGVTRLVNTGTAWQHFGTDHYNPVNLYAATKQACLDLLRYYHDARGLSVVTLKLFDTYGAGDKRRKIVQILLEAALSGEPLGMSPGEQILDLTHVEDVVQAFVVAADRLLLTDMRLNEEFLISGERLALKDLVMRVGAITGRPIKVEFGARPYRAREVMLPAEPRTEAVLPGWMPRRQLQEVLQFKVSPLELADMEKLDESTSRSEA